MVKKGKSSDVVRRLIEEADRAVWRLIMGEAGATPAIRKKHRAEAVATGKRLQKIVGETIVECGMFSLTCTECDAGAEIKTPAQARRKKWTELHPDPNGRTATYTGLCPECRKEQPGE